MTTEPKETSRVSGFYRLSPEDRVHHIAEFSGLSEADRTLLRSNVNLTRSKAQHMIENATSVFGLPLGFAANFRVNGVERFMPMVIEEPSVVAAASHAAKLLRGGPGIETTSTDPVMIGQIQICELEDASQAKRLIEEHGERLLEQANATQPRLCERGGGAREIQARIFEDTEIGTMVVLHLLVDVRDAMGANMVNTMVETIAPACQALVGGEVCLKILSNLADQRMVMATGRVPIRALDRPENGMEGAKVADRLVKASVFAEVDPYRAATHNKGFMNGVDAFLIAMGQDWRAVEAGAHAYAARTGTYSALAKWRVDGEFLVGTAALPMQVGTVGGIVQVHPLVAVNHRIMNMRSASELGEMAAAVGLAQNLAAILALSTDGIQRGHMALHARNVAAAAGASEGQVEAIANQMVAEKAINLESASRLLGTKK